MIPPRAYRVMLPALSVAAVLTLAGCDPEQSASGTGQEGGGSRGGGQAATGFGASPLDNADGTKPGLAPLASGADRAAGRKIIEKVATKGRGPKTGYARDRFGYAWKDSIDGIPLARNGCDTRNDLLARDGKDVKFRSGSDCVVVSMTLKDPYTGSTIEWRKQQATKVQIDHVMPLSYDWQMGAAH
ncbi:HNH endonuclease, partial [Streptomyces sp. NPDC088178]